MTMSFGVVNEEIDFHLTKVKSKRNPEEKHVSLFKIKHEHVSVVLNVLIARLTNSIIKEVTPEILSKEGYQFTYFPSEDEKDHKKLEKTFHSNFKSALTKKDKKKEEYSLMIGENEKKKFKKISEDIDHPLNQWKEKNTYDPKVLDEFHGNFMGMVTLEEKAYPLLSFQVENCNKHFLILNEKLSNRSQFQEALFGKSFGEKVGEKWDESIKLLDLSQDEINGHSALEITPKSIILE
jgi:hypothetical protein